MEENEEPRLIYYGRYDLEKNTSNIFSYKTLNQLDKRSEFNNYTQCYYTRDYDNPASVLVDLMSFINKEGWKK